MLALALAAPWEPGTTVVQADAVPDGVQWLDARQAGYYARGHVPGAANAHWEELAGYDADGVWSVTDAHQAAALLARRGLDKDRPIVVYADWDTSWGGDGYLYWVLHYLGIDEVAVLDGGFDAWVAAGGATDTLRPAAGDLAVVRVREELLATTAEVAAPVPGTILLDVRSLPEWLLGRIPNAVHLRYTRMVDGSGKLRPEAELRAELASVGLTDPHTPVITYCEGGIRAGHTFWVLDSLGFDAVVDYVGSWRAYSHAELPKEW